MNTTTADDKNCSAQHNPFSGKSVPELQAFLSQMSAKGEENCCPCPLLVSLIEELIREKAKSAQCQHLHFGKSSEKSNTVFGGLDQPDTGSNTDDSNFPPDSNEQSQHKTQDSSEHEPDNGNTSDLGADCLEENSQEHSVQDSVNDEASKPVNNVTPIKKRGAKPGHKGHGRHIPIGLNKREVYIPVPPEQRFCPICGIEGTVLPLAFAEKSTQVDIKVIVELITYYREKMKFDCGHVIVVPQQTAIIEEMSREVSPELSPAMNNGILIPLLSS